MRRLTITMISLSIALILTVPAWAYWTDDLKLFPYKSRFFSIDRPPEYTVASESEDYGLTQFFPSRANKHLKNMRVRILVIRFPGDLNDYSQAVGNEFKHMSVNGTFEYSTLDTEPATKFIYETKNEENAVKTVRVFTIKDGRIFDLQFSFPVHRFNDLLPLVERLIATFRISDENQ